jgi:hypothetical protein
MSGTNQPHDQYLLQTIRDVQAGLFALSTSPLLNNGAIQKGCLQVLDGAGNPRVQMGLIPDGLGLYGIRMLNAAGVELFRTDDRGIVLPGQAMQSQPAVPMNANGEEVDVTSAAMVNTFTVIWALPVAAEGLIVTVPWITDAATTGAIQLISTRGGNTPTATQALPAGSSGDHVAHWLHGVPIGAPGVNLTLQAERTGGTGNVRIFYPTFQFIGPAGMAANGGWT